MKKKKLRKKLKKALKKLAKRKSVNRKRKEVVPLLEKVREQLQSFVHVTEVAFWRDPFTQLCPTVEEYEELDPYWMSTMTGQMTGRRLGEKR